MEKEFVSHQPSFDLKELGFDEECLDFYDDSKELFYFSENKDKIHIGEGIKSPLYQQAFRWFREKYSYQSFISPSNELTYLAYDFTLKGFDGYFKSKQFKTYEEAELECLKKLIEIVKNEKNISNIS